MEPAARRCLISDLLRWPCQLLLLLQARRMPPPAHVRPIPGAGSPLWLGTPCPLRPEVTGILWADWSAACCSELAAACICSPYSSLKAAMRALHGDAMLQQLVWLEPGGMWQCDWSCRKRHAKVATCCLISFLLLRHLMQPSRLSQDSASVSSRL